MGKGHKGAKILRQFRINSKVLLFDEQDAGIEHQTAVKVSDVKSNHGAIVVRQQHTADGVFSNFLCDFLLEFNRVCTRWTTKDKTVHFYGVFYRQNLAN